MNSYQNNEKTKWTLRTLDCKPMWNSFVNIRIRQLRRLSFVNARYTHYEKFCVVIKFQCSIGLDYSIEINACFKWFLVFCEFWFINFKLFSCPLSIQIIKIHFHTYLDLKTLNYSCTRKKYVLYSVECVRSTVIIWILYSNTSVSKTHDNWHIEGKCQLIVS